MSTFIYPPTPPASGGATEATLLQVEQNTADTVTELQDVNLELNSQTTELQAANASLDAIEADVNSLEAKTASGMVTEAHDYQEITYVGVTTRIDTVTFKSGGSGGTTVAVLTMGYDGSDRLTSVTKT